MAPPAPKFYPRSAMSQGQVLVSVSATVGLALGVTAACAQTGTGADCEKEIRFNDVVYSSRNAEVTGLDHPVGSAILLGCDDTGGSGKRFEAGEVEVWGLEGIEPAVAVAVVFGTDAGTGDALLFLPGTDYCEVEPKLLERVRLVEPPLCSAG